MVVIIIKLVKVIQIDRQEVIKLELLLFQMFPIQDFILELEVVELMFIEQVVQFIILVLVGQVHY
jgi:hypothetical protein